MISDKLYRALAQIPALQYQFRRVVRRLPHRRRNVDHFGQRLNVDPSELHGFYLYYEREYDDYIFEFIEKRACNYQRALDLGANIGIYTAFLAAHVPRVDAFEPDPDILNRLRSNLTMNRHCNVTIHPVCVGKNSGTVHFSRGSAANQGVGKVVHGERDDTRRVRSFTLDEFFAGPVDCPTLVKMDIEGSEWLALQGCTESVGKRTARVDMLIEIHPEDIVALGGTMKSLYQMLVGLDFSISAVTPDGLSGIETASPHRFWWASDARTSSE